VETLADVSELGVMGLGAVLREARPLLGAARRLLSETRTRGAPAALLAGYSEFNAWLGPRLRRLGVSVLWYGAPQAWAWRPRRAERIRRSCDRLALILPFEEPWWQRRGVDAEYVGHPSLERRATDRATARARLGIGAGTTLVALLPGSRSQEVRRALPIMLRALAALRARLPEVDARVLPAPTLPARDEVWLREATRQAGVEAVNPTLDRDPIALLPGCDVAWATSGTVTLECALLGVPPVIGYRTDAATAFVARRLLGIDTVGLPNLVLGRPVFPELLQNRFDAAALVRETIAVLEARDTFASLCAEVRQLLLRPTRLEPSARVAEMLSAWLT
jgi:lipid-A-disaccharide synthase